MNGNILIRSKEALSALVNSFENQGIFLVSHGTQEKQNGTINGYTGSTPGGAHVLVQEKIMGRSSVSIDVIVKKQEFESKPETSVFDTSYDPEEHKGGLAEATPDFTPSYGDFHLSIFFHRTEVPEGYVDVRGLFEDSEIATNPDYFFGLEYAHFIEDQDGGYDIGEYLDDASVTPIDPEEFVDVEEELANAQDPADSLDSIRDDMFLDEDGYYKDSTAQEVLDMQYGLHKAKWDHQAADVVAKYLRAHGQELGLKQYKE